jgi:hypothetical protein
MTSRILLAAMLLLLASGSLIKLQADDTPKPIQPAQTPKPLPADAEAPLPKDWPAATKTNQIEIKSYPAYRCAVARDSQSTMNNKAKLFWPLFLHIQREGIAMTTPVAMTYDPHVLEHGGKGEGSMEFLYRQPDQGKAGPAAGTVKVEDRPAATFLCIGIQGRVDEARITESLTKLNAWLDQHKTEWIPAGPPRELGYHGPNTPMSRHLGELQIPLERVTNNQKSQK